MDSPSNYQAVGRNVMRSGDGLIYKRFGTPERAREWAARMNRMGAPYRRLCDMGVPPQG